MKKILMLLFVLSLTASAQAGWWPFGNYTTEAAFSSNTVNASTYYQVEDSDVACKTWQIWEKTGTVDIIVVTDGTLTSEYPNGNTLAAVSEKVVWAGTVFSSRLFKKILWIKGNTTNATVLYSAETD